MVIEYRDSATKGIVGKDWVAYKRKPKQFTNIFHEIWNKLETTEVDFENLVDLLRELKKESKSLAKFSLYRYNNIIELNRKSVLPLIWIEKIKKD